MPLRDYLELINLANSAMAEMQGIGAETDLDD